MPVPLYLRESRNFAFDPQELESKITPRTKLLILNSPQNPTGGILTRKDLEAIAAILRKHPRIWIYADEIYSRLVFEGKIRIHRFAARHAGNAPSFSDGCSKTWAMTGWRIGLTASKALAADVHQMGHQYRFPARRTSRNGVRWPRSTDRRTTPR